MDDNLKKSHNGEHNQPPSDDTLRKKIDKHLSDKEDTISEEDIKKINTGAGAEKSPAVPDKISDEEKEIDETTKDDNDEEPDKEAPTPWEILS